MSSIPLSTSYHRSLLNLWGTVPREQRDMGAKAIPPFPTSSEQLQLIPSGSLFWSNHLFSDSVSMKVLNVYIFIWGTFLFWV